MPNEKHTGSCLCGAVRFEINGPLKDVSYCHCSQCRKMTGHHFATTDCQKEDLHFTEDRGLKWYRASDFAARGFCQECGSSLFWKGDTDEEIGILAGSLDGATHLKAASHIYVADKGDYYDITDGLPQFQQERD